MIDYKKIIIFFITLSAPLRAEFMLLDQGVTVVSGPVANTIITHSDVYDKLNLDGSMISLDHQIKNEIIRQEVLESNMPIDENIADKHLANIQKINNLSHDDLERLAGECYRTFLELKQLLNLQYIYDFFLYHKFRAHLVPTDQDVQDYCDENPEIEPGYCLIEVAFVDFDQDNKKEVKDKLDGIIAGAISDHAISWSDPIHVDISDIADDKKFINDMEPGTIHCIESKKSFELYRLVEKKSDYIVPVEDRKAFVVDILNRKMYEDLLKKYEEQMVDNIAIINLV